MDEEMLNKWASIVRVAKLASAEGRDNMVVDLDVLLAVDVILNKAAAEVMERRGLMEIV